MMARELSFSDFIRARMVQDEKQPSNYQTRFLGGPLAGLPAVPEAAAKEVLDRYDIVGVTSDLPRFVERLALSTGYSGEVVSVLARVDSNASKGDDDLSDEQWAEVAEQNTFDLALYQEALRRSRQ